MDLNKLREQLQQSKPVRVTRSGRLESEDGRPVRRSEGPSRLKKHTFAWFGRLDQERTLMKKHTQARECTFEGNLAFEETIETNFGLPFTFRIVVPSNFPVAAPRVYCLSPEVPHTLEYHTYSDGHLCLYQPGEWSTRTTLVDVRNWTCEWAFNVVPKLHGLKDWMSPEHR